MNIICLCEPIFQYITLLDKNIQSEKLSYDRVREDIEKLLLDIKNSSVLKDYEAWKMFEDIHLPLLCFIDYKISNSGNLFAGEWDKHRLAYNESCYTGDKKFFENLEVILSEKSKSNNDDVLLFFYTCIKLGFLGIYKSDSKKVKNYLWEISRRINVKYENKSKFLFNNLYKNADMKNQNAPIKSVRKKCILVLVMLILSYLLLSFGFYYSATKNYFDILAKINDRFTISKKLSNERIKLGDTDKKDYLYSRSNVLLNNDKNSTTIARTAMKKKAEELLLLG
jgi:hypothetical protein